MAANNPKLTRQRAASANPKGIACSSPRLRGTSYLGSRFANGNQHQRGCDQNHSIGVATNLPQPRWGCSRFATFTQGRRERANLGLWATAPLGLARKAAGDIANPASNRNNEEHMTSEINRCYRALELEPGASLEQVKQAWREMVKVWHPDRFPNDAKMQRKAQERLKDINGAYEILRACFQNRKD